MGSLAIERLEGAAAVFAARSRGWGPTRGADALLAIGSPSDEAVVLGAFQRAGELGEGAYARALRRGSGGGAARVGPGTVWLQLSLARPDALIACTPDKLLNRYVRPLLRALTRAAGVPVSYFGRDWISAAHRPVALVGLGHEATTNRALFEAVVAVSTPLSVSDRPSFLGKVPATLDEIAGRALDPQRVVEVVVDAYRTSASAHVDRPSGEAPSIDEGTCEVAWSATREEAIGTIGAGLDASGRLRVGGELMVSRDALARLEALLAALPADASEDDIGRAVDEALGSGGAITFGVRSLASIRDAIVEARGRLEG
ncbi:MAG: hypothetical protein BGO98_36035 [Myxococcales bacterium 68-20]|nr:MAG: hypothetical protein BGO98_36035 [Myxococcales bacterium 68-20]